MNEWVRSKQMRNEHHFFLVVFFFWQKINENEKERKKTNEKNVENNEHLIGSFDIISTGRKERTENGEEKKLPFSRLFLLPFQFTGSWKLIKILCAAGHGDISIKWAFEYMRRRTTTRTTVASECRITLCKSSQKQFSKLFATHRLCNRHQHHHCSSATHLCDDCATRFSKAKLNLSKKFLWMHTHCIVAVGVYLFVCVCSWVPCTPQLLSTHSTYILHQSGCSLVIIWLAERINPQWRLCMFSGARFTHSLS